MRWFYKKKPLLCGGRRKRRKAGVKMKKLSYIIAILLVRSREKALHSQKILRIT